MSNRPVDYILQKLHNLHIHDCQVIFKRNCDIFRAFLTMYWHKNGWRKHIFLAPFIIHTNNLEMYLKFQRSGECELWKMFLKYHKDVISEKKKRKVKDYLKSLDSLKRIKKHVRVQFSQNGCRVNHGFNLQKCSCFVRPVTDGVISLRSDFQKGFLCISILT
jgi:hypothetical protein